jgi:probable HAF family extracellular repeat protein
MKTFHWKTGMALMILAVTALLASRPAQAAYTITDLGVGYTAQDMNNAGQVVGYITNPGSTYSAFLYSGGTMTNLGTFGNVNAKAYGINNNGQIIISTSDVVNGTADQRKNNRSFIYNSNNGTTETIAHFSDSGTYPTGINDAGQVVGHGSVSGSIYPHVFVYENGTVTDIGTWGLLGVPSTVLINNSGRVSGSGYVAAGTSPWKAYISDLDGQNAVDIGNLGSSSSALSIYGLNDLGQAVGRSAYTDGKNHAFLYDGTMHDLTALVAGATAGYARGINNEGQVVGTYTDSNGNHPFLYENGQMIDIWSQITNGAGWTITSATYINENGQIVGSGTFDGATHLYLLSPGTAPVPIPPAVWMFGSGLMGLVGLRRRMKS